MLFLLSALLSFSLGFYKNPINCSIAIYSMKLSTNTLPKLLVSYAHLTFIYATITMLTFLTSYEWMPLYPLHTNSFYAGTSLYSFLCIPQDLHIVSHTVSAL